MGSILQTVESMLGASQVTSWEALGPAWQSRVHRAIAAESPPDCIAYPNTVEQLAELVTCAHQHQWRLLPCGHGSKLSWGAPVTGADVVVSTQHLNHVVEHAVGDLTVTAQAGVGFAELQAALLQTRQFLAIDPAYPQQATLGGIVATRDTGALRQRYGSIRDMLIGVSFVRHDGQLAKAGGRVVKNVAGYDLMKLMSGSFGTLGILTQLTWRTFPQQETAQTIFLSGAATDIRAVTAAVLRSPLTPAKLDLLSPGLGPDQGKQFGLAVQFQSIAAGVAEQVERLAAIAQPYELQQQTLSDVADDTCWQTLTAALLPDDHPENLAIAKVGILPAQAVDLLASLQTILEPGTWRARLHASSGLGILQLSCAQNSPEQLTAVRSRCQAADGYLNLLDAPADWKQQLDPWALDDAARLLMTRLQKQFDPQGRLSPGRLR
ncbi:MAG: FAD-binding oxidoreductase [Cyanobacteria bacterium P01_A01_bin.70]